MASKRQTDPAAAGEAEAGRPEYRVEALAKGLRILSLFTEQRPTWRVSDLAPGVRVLTLGTAALRSLDLVEVATPRLQQLGSATGETVNLAVLTGDQVLYLVRLRNSDLVTANIQVGSTLPAVHTSIGKLLLAHLDRADLEARITDASFARSHGPNAKVSLDELLGELSRIRADGWAMQDEELAFGLRSVAAPVRDASGRVIAGVNLAVPARDWSSRRIVRELRPRVTEAGADISALLGHAGAAA
jgi:IclR family pca regulon transcriptional regulator